MLVPIARRILPLLLLPLMIVPVILLNGIGSSTSPGTTEMVSVDSAGNQGHGLSRQPAFGGGGPGNRYVAFRSEAPDLVPGDTNGMADVFVHDRETGATVRVTDGNNSSGERIDINHTGRYVAFDSYAGNLVVGDTNGNSDVFVHDRDTDADGIFDEPGATKTVRVSISSWGDQAIGGSYQPSITITGRYVAFYSVASNLVDGDTNGHADVFLHDRDMDGDGVFDEPGNINTIRVSVDSYGNQAIGGGSFEPAVSGDAEYIVYYSNANNLVPGDTNGVADIFMYDRWWTNTGTTRLSVDSYGNQANGASYGPSISINGRAVAFWSYASDLVIGDTTLCGPIGIQYNCPDVFVRDRDMDNDGIYDETGTVSTVRVSVDSAGEQGDGHSQQPDIGGSGEYVAFGSLASNLVLGDTNGVMDTFLHNRDADHDSIMDEPGATSTIRVSVDSSSDQANGQSYNPPALSVGGDHVAFGSDATNLVDVDTNGYPDVFVHHASWEPPPTPTPSPTPTEVPSAMVRIEPAVVRSEVGSSFTAKLMIDEVSNLGSYGFALTYAPAVLQYVSVQNGPFLGSTGRTVDCDPPIVEPGRIRFNCATSGSEPPGPSGSGLLAEVTLTTLRPGTSPLQLESVSLADPLGNPLSTARQGGSVLILAPPEVSLGGPSENPFVPHSSEPINLATGNYTYEHTDLVISGRGLPLAFTRSYNALDSSSGPLGAGWTHNYNVQLLIDDTNPSATVATMINEGGRQDVYEEQPDGSFIGPPGIFAELVENPDGTFTLTQNDKTVLDFDASGIIQSMADRNGNSTTLAYDGADRLAGVTDSSGRSLNVAYDGSGRISTVTDPIGRVVSYGYDGNGDLVQVTDPGGGIVEYTYDSSHRMLTITDARGNVSMTNVYDAEGRVVSQTNALGKTWGFSYDPETWTTVETDPLGRTTTYAHDEYHREISRIDALGNTTAYSYDADGNCDSATDALGRTTLYAYDSRGNIVSITDALGNASALTYSAWDDVLSETDPLGRTTTYTYDANRNLLTRTDALGGVASMTYNSQGRLLTTTDPLVRTSSFTYDSNGHPASATDALGNTTYSVYDNAGRLLSETDARGHTTSYTYDDMDRVLTVTDALGNITTNSYDSNGNLTSVTDAPGNATSYVYDALNQLTMITDAAGGSIAYGYDAVGNLVSTTDARGNTTTHAYDELNRLVSTTDPLGNTSTNAYDAVGNLVSTTDANGNTTTYAYDELNRLVSTTDPLGSISTYAYDAADNVVSTTDANGNMTTYVYDALDRITSTTDSMGNTISKTYDAAGNLVSTTDARGNTTTFAYDELNRLVSTTDPLGNTSTNAYDAAGNMVSTTDANGNTTTYAYDELSRLASVTDPIGGTTAYAYDANGNTTSVTDASGKVTSYTYDALNQLETVTDAEAGTVSYGYDEVGNRTSMTDANSHTTTYEYDSLNRLISVSDPEGNVTAYTYDAVGNRLTRTDANDVTTTYTYDSLNRLTRITYPDQPAVSYTYDALGNRLSMTDLTGTTTYSYDALYQLTSVVNPGGGTISYGYDAAGNRTSITYPDGKVVTYGYDDASRLETVADWADRVTTYIYDDASRLTAADLPNGVHTARSYSNANQLLEIAHTKDASNLMTIGYTVDDVGNRLTRSETVETAPTLTDIYGYDDLYRLTSVDYGNPSYPDQTYTYDPMGNRSQLVEGATTTDYTYDDADRLLTAGSTNYEFDGNGNQTREGNRTFAYDRENRLIQVADWTSPADGICADTNWDGTVNSGDLLAVANAFGTRAGSDAYQPVLDPRQDGVINSGDLLLIAGKLLQQCHVVDASAYNGDGLRVYRSENGTTRRFTWDVAAELPVILRESSGTSYEYGLELILEEISGVATYHHQDGLGSTVMTTDATGTAVGVYAYDVFGAARTGSPTFGYAGEQRDASGLVYLRARSYDVATGRFLTRDPQPGIPTLSQTLHPYAYSMNNPANITDPRGTGFWGSVKAKAQSAVTSVKAAASSAKAKTEQFVQEKVVAPVVQAATPVVAKAKQTAAQAVTKIQQTAAPVVTKTKQVVAQTVTKIQQKVQEVKWGQAGGGAVKMVVGLGEAVTGVVMVSTGVLAPVGAVLALHGAYTFGAGELEVETAVQGVEFRAHGLFGEVLTLAGASERTVRAVDVVESLGFAALSGIGGVQLVAAGSTLMGGITAITVGGSLLTAGSLTSGGDSNQVRGTSYANPQLPYAPMSSDVRSFQPILGGSTGGSASYSTGGSFAPVATGGAGSLAPVAAGGPLTAVSGPSGVSRK